MARTAGSLNISSNLEPRMSAPLDARTIVNTKEDLLAEASFPYFYEGMTVYVKSEQKAYTLVGDDTTDEDNWRAVGSGADEELTTEQVNTLLSIL